MNGRQEERKCQVTYAISIDRAGLCLSTEPQFVNDDTFAGGTTFSRGSTEYSGHLVVKSQVGSSVPALTTSIHDAQVTHCTVTCNATERPGAGKVGRLTQGQGREQTGGQRVTAGVRQDENLNHPRGQSWQRTGACPGPVSGRRAVQGSAWSVTLRCPLGELHRRNHVSCATLKGVQNLRLILVVIFLGRACDN